MKTVKLLLLLTMLGASIAPVMAQDDEHEETGNDRVESLKIAFITEKLNLTSSEAKNFWPVYNEFESQIKRLRAKEKENIASLKAKTAVSDQDADKFMVDQLQLKQQQLDLTKRYIGEFKKVLPAKKVARLLMLEQEFKQQLLKRLKDRRGKM